jgi:hypothetical protein
MTDDEITALMARLRTFVQRNGHNDMAVTTIDTDHARAILALVDAQAAEIARLREALGFYANLPCRLEFGVVNECPYDDGDTARAALAQETQP